MVANKYRVDALLGSGSTCDVYLCTHTGLDKVVALKILHADMVKHENFVERFKREARAASKLEHPNSVRVLDFGEDAGGILYIAMEYIAGRDLWTMLDEEWPLDNARIVDVMSQVLGALSKAHSLGIVHRDLKPENIMVQHVVADDGERDHVTVCDFGIAQLSPIQLSGSFESLTATVTGDGMVVGTPAYMSPEQARAEPLDARSDVYSAGVVLFQMLTRQLPFTAETPLAVAVMHCSTPPPAPSQYALVHPALEAVCLRALSKTKEARYQSARDMQLALQEAMSATHYKQPAKKRRPYLPLSPLSAPPVKLPPPARPAPPASLAPFERTAEFTGGEPVTTSKRNVWVGVAVIVAIGALSLSPRLFDDSAESMASSTEANVDSRPAPDSDKTSAAAMDAPVVRAPQPVAAPAPTATPAPEPFAAPEPQVALIDQQLAATPRVARTPAAKSTTATASSMRAPTSNETRERAPAAARGKAQPTASRSEGDEPAVTATRSPVTAAAAFETTKVKAPAPEVAAKSQVTVTPVAQSAEIEVKPVDLEPEIPVGLVDIPTRPHAADGEAKVSVTQAGAPPVVTASVMPASFDHAQVRFTSIVTQAAVSKASIRNALNESAMRRCYSDALRLGTASPAPTSARLDLETNMGGRIATATISSPGLPKTLINCLEGVARSGRVREVDTGIAKATVTLEFQP
ncbi:MAG TPA: protein kinase [Polyangiales bacterium]|nr:protein kinase [Polyangiales bacterium]